MGWGYLGGRLFSNARVVIFDFWVSFSIVIIETPHISAERYSVANHWRLSKWQKVTGLITLKK